MTLGERVFFCSLSLLAEEDSMGWSQDGSPKLGTHLHEWQPQCMFKSSGEPFKSAGAQAPSPET
jgi:hypothetical protein